MAENDFKWVSFNAWFWFRASRLKNHSTEEILKIWFSVSEPKDYTEDELLLLKWEILCERKYGIKTFIPEFFYKVKFVNSHIERINKLISEMEFGNKEIIGYSWHGIPLPFSKKICKWIYKKQEKGDKKK